MPTPKKEAKAPELKAFRLLAGAHVGPDYSADPDEVTTPTGEVVLRYPPRQYKAAVVGTARAPGDSNIVYSPSDLSEKFNRPNSQRFLALGDPPAAVRERFKESFDTGVLDGRHSGVTKATRRQFLSVGAGNRTPGTSEVGPLKGTTPPDPKGLAGDPHDLTPPVGEEGAEEGEGEGEGEDLYGMTVAELRETAEAEDIEVPSRATKDELVAAIEKGRKGK